MDDTDPTQDPVATNRTKLLGALCLATLTALAAGRALAPAGALPWRAQDASGSISAAHTHPGGTLAAGLLLTLGAAGLAAMFPSLARLVRGRGHREATAAAVLGATGGMCASLLASGRYLDPYAAVWSGVAPKDGARILASTQSSVVTTLFVLGAAVVLPVAVVLQGTALWRAGDVPRWVPLLFVGGFLLVLLTPTGLLAPLFAVPFLAASLYLALQLLRPGSGGSEGPLAPPKETWA